MKTHFKSFILTSVVFVVGCSSQETFKAAGTKIQSAVNPPQETQAAETPLSSEPKLDVAPAVAPPQVDPGIVGNNSNPVPPPPVPPTPVPPTPVPGTPPPPPPTPVDPCVSTVSGTGGSSGGFGTVDDGKTQGLVGKVYALSNGTLKLPDFTKMTPMSTVVSLNINTPTRAWTQGFPGVPDLTEWFGISFSGKLFIPSDGLYKFKTLSDDGSNLYIDTDLVVNNDGWHGPTERQGEKTLTMGPHDIVLDYFQGPKVQIALVLYWMPPGTTTWEVIPAEAFDRPNTCRTN